MFRNTTFLLAALVFGAISLSAQTGPSKYGHMNLGNVLSEMPATAQADKQLRIFADSLSQKDSLMTDAFQAAYLQLKKEYEEKSLTAVQVQQRQMELEKQRQAIQDFEKAAQEQIEAKRGEMLKPIFDRIETAIKEVAKENGFLMIFDIGTGSMLFAAESIDITPLVKMKLGLP